MAIDDYANFDLAVPPTGNYPCQKCVLRTVAGHGQTLCLALPFSPVAMYSKRILSGLEL